ncbi:MAG TPA: DUF4337 domain-containing protein [Candidatus Dormibacteraeota bacterium]|nr:DUF4337 domain-containing protein [Candidatus Dormibacteraeota bacterium]
MPEGFETPEHPLEPELLPVSLTLSILAVLVAGVTLLGHRTHTEELLLQARATDQWAFYQAKNIRRHNYEMFSDLLSVVKGENAGQVSTLREKYKKELERYAKDKEEIQSEARALEKERDVQRKKADRFDAGEGLLEIALVITSITLLTRRRMFWHVGMLVALGGVSVALTAFWIH